jgi:hypothetical protein
VRRPLLAKLGEQVVRIHVERILLNQAADDHDGMRSQRMDHRARTELRQVVGADDGVVVFGS